MHPNQEAYVASQQARFCGPGIERSAAGSPMGIGAKWNPTGGRQSQPQAAKGHSRAHVWGPSPKCPVARGVTDPTPAPRPGQTPLQRALGWGELPTQPAP